MVSKSYVVSKFAKTLKKNASSEDDVVKRCCDMQCSDHNMSETKKNRNSNLFVIHMNNEMVS